jgi:hypothetical protein
MYCPKCGTKNDDNAFRCINCSEVIQPVQIVKRVDDADNPEMRMLLPIGRSPYAIIAGYLGLFSLIIFPAPFALIFGILAVRDIKKNPKKHGMGRAIFGIVMGTIFSFILLIFLFIAILNVIFPS